MNLTLIIISIVVLGVFSFNQYIRYKRFKAVNNLKIIYDRMEMYFVRKEIILNNDYIAFLKSFKNLSVNPEYLDIQVLMANKMMLEKKGMLVDGAKKFDETLESLGKDFMPIFQEFDNNTTEIIKLSLVKPDFLFFISQLVFKKWLKSKKDAIQSIKSDLKYAFANDEAISYSGMGLEYC
ncbi:hypothetical protein E7Z59_08230 [Robertkochia marina]|uniref:Uncharacterized protein n=1 Tax=Robertkochia marina TaxID=1227945 RepID=A0A4V3UY49_9FLAO|nr:hypothetical protein [Robertkochia marina]THD67636.1 hypothetical protein E7Z59_08230 [Robertkochia marina]TRZ43369.1 hypothetical protein D3A96_10370 [Robertkochia marina]